MSLIHNEKTKLSATFLNSIAVALVAVGLLSPWVSVFSVASAPSIVITMLVGLVCGSSAAALHFTARKLLERLQP